MIWARALEARLAIEIERCWRCGGRLWVIASIEDETVIERILGHLQSHSAALDRTHASRAPPAHSPLWSPLTIAPGHARLTGGFGHHLCPANVRSVFLSQSRSFTRPHGESMAAPP